MPFDSEETTSPTGRRGGGPPGGSSFLSSRLRQSAEAREAELKRQQDEAFGNLESNDFRYDTLVDDPVAVTTPAPEYDWEATPISQPTATAAAPAGPRPPSFPGGRVKLPQLGETPDNPDVTFVGTAFVRRTDDDGNDQNASGAFEEYFTYESLFDAPIADPLRTDSSLEGDDPYFVLGVDPEAPWREIVAAHRGLVKTHHPDRLHGASPAQLAHSEEALRLVNRAYGELRRRGRDIEDEAGATG
jgi:DnaJ-domain-containing protein 1